MFSITRFAQLLEALPRAQVERLSETMRVGRYDKTFKPYDHLLALLYAQFSGARSLREVETGFNAQAASHYHLGTQALRRTTLSDANQRRDPALFKALAERNCLSSRRWLR
jgi:putative transposase